MLPDECKYFTVSNRRKLPQGAAVTEANAALQAIDLEWDKHDFRPVRDHFLASPGELKELEERIVTDGRVHTDELEFLREALFRDGKIGRKEADFLAVLRKRLQFRSPAFEKFFRQAIKSHVLTDGRIHAAERGGVVAVEFLTAT